MPSIGVQAAGSAASARTEESVTLLKEAVIAQPDTLVNTARYKHTNNLFIELDVVACFIQVKYMMSLRKIYNILQITVYSKLNYFNSTYFLPVRTPVLQSRSVRAVCSSASVEQEDSAIKPLENACAEMDLLELCEYRKYLRIIMWFLTSLCILWKDFKC